MEKETKLCKACGVEKELKEFAKRTDTKNSRRNKCRNCINLKRRGKKRKGGICGIYKITSPSNRVYIGQSEDIKVSRVNRYRNNNCEGQPKLCNSIKKYGWENHTFEIIEECEVENLNCRERYWQEYYDVLNGGLNCVLQECGEKRRELSEETVKKQRNNVLGERNPNWKGGRTFCECGNRIGSSANKCIKCFDKVGENNPFFGKHHSDETKAKISESRKGNLPPNSLKVEIYGVVYLSLNKASEELGIIAGTIRHRCLSKNIKYKDYKIIGSEIPEQELYTPNCKVVICDDIEYPSLAQAKKELKCSMTKILYRIKSEKFKNWYYKNE